MTIEYKIISSPRLERMEENVSKMLNEGWTLAGQLFIAGTGGMAQALTKETKEERKAAKSVPMAKGKAKSDASED